MSEQAARGDDWGSTLRALRKAKGLSLRAFAQRAGVNFTYVSRIERGQFPPPSTKTIERMAAVLDTDPDALAAMAGRVTQGYVRKLEAQAAACRDAVKACRWMLDLWDGGSWGAPPAEYMPLVRAGAAALDEAER